MNHLTKGQQSHRAYDLCQMELHRAGSSYEMDHHSIISRIADRMIQHDKGHAIYAFT